MALVLMLLVSLLKLGSGQWQVVGPDKPIQVLVGEDVIVPCFISPEINAEAMEVRFFKEELSAVVHLFRDGKDQNYMQMPVFQGRTNLVKDFIMNGHVLLRLKKVTLSDTGLYGCWFGSQTYSQEATWELQVSEMGSSPLISIVGYDGGGIQLLCQSSGWLSQPIAKWKGPEGLDLPSDFKVNKDMHGLFHVETTLTVHKNSGIISCSIQLADQKRELKSRLFIGKTFFKISPWLPPSIVLMVLCIGGAVCIIGMRISSSKSQGKLQNELEWRENHRQEEFKEAQKHAVKVTLDPDTAHPNLYISKMQAVICNSHPQDVPCSKKRFKRRCVVAIQGFQSGKHYWEVGVGNNNMWYLGVCRDDVDRNEKYVILSPNNGYWVLGLERENFYFVSNPNRIYFFLESNPSRVGVFLDYEGGTLSFFNVDDQSLIYTLTYQFEGLLKPFIQHNSQYEENMTPIVICPVPS
ncbi:butyrophilin-like protein 8 [Castor canadensis]|uniref:Butyrophilin-like protein 8 n=2 Tax=Castor canadensis TaxID=51338 RepID=A0AC58LC73_CASCN